MSNQVAIKTHRLTLNISANSRTKIITNTTFFTADIGTARKIITIVDNNRVLDLSDAKVIIGFEFEGAAKRKIVDSETDAIQFTDPERGELELSLPNSFFKYTGDVLLHVFIQYPDGRANDVGVIVTKFKESWLDEELPEMNDFYVKRFEDLAEEVRRRAEDIKAEMDSELKGVKGDIATAQTDIDRITSQINDNDIVRQIELDTAGFGENNLIRNSTEPIIINPDGSLTHGHITHAPNLELGETYTFCAEGEFLRGSSDGISIILWSSNNLNTASGNNVGNFVIDFNNGDLEITFITPSEMPNANLLLLVYAGRVARTSGNTLKLTNQMLTAGTKPQPYRPAFEDDKERLDALKPTTAPLPLAPAPQIGTSKQFSNADHAHEMPTASQVGALPLTGNATTATRLQTPRLINGVAFDGSTNINIRAQSVAVQIRDWDDLSDIIRLSPAFSTIDVWSQEGSLNSPSGESYMQGVFHRYDNAHGLLKIWSVHNRTDERPVFYYRRFGRGWGIWITSQV